MAPFFVLCPDANAVPAAAEHVTALYLEYVAIKFLTGKLLNDKLSTPIYPF